MAINRRFNCSLACWRIFAIDGARNPLFRAYAMESYPQALQKDPDTTFPYGEACNLGQMVWQSLCLLGTFPGAGWFPSWNSIGGLLFTISGLASRQSPGLEDHLHEPGVRPSVVIGKTLPSRKPSPLQGAQSLCLKISNSGEGCTEKWATPEHWILPSFMEAAYVVNCARDTKDPRGMMSLARIHKRSPFYPDISFQEYKQHLTIMPLTPPTEDGLGYCGYTENFAVGALHRRPDCRRNDLLGPSGLPESSSWGVGVSNREQ